MKTITMTLAAIAAAALSPSAMAQTVTNGSFENPSANGGFIYGADANTIDSTFNSIAGVAANGSAFGYTTPFGSQVGFLQANASTFGSINQIVRDLVAGQSYTLNFFSAQRPQFENRVLPINVSFDNVNLGIVTPTSTAFTSSSFSFTASDTTGTLRFFGDALDANADFNAAIDNITISAPGAVPEPATWGMMLVGFGMIGFGMRRRKSNVRTTVRFA